MKTVPAAEFKAHCLSLLEKVRKTSRSLVVTKHGKPVVCVQPYVPHRAARASAHSRAASSSRRI